MTISITKTRTSYAGSGSTGPFAVADGGDGIYFAAADELILTRIDDSDGSETTLAYPADFAVAGAGSASGAVTLTDALAVGETLVIERDTARTQTYDPTLGGAFNPDNVEDALDKLTRAVQDLATARGQALRLAVQDRGSISAVLPAAVASKYLRWNSDGDGLTTGNGLDWEGAWQTSTAYVEGQVVSHDGSSYVCLEDHTSAAASEPGTGVSWATYWDLATAAGADGADGTDGTNVVWHAASGAPSAGTGADGDMYLDTTSGDVYGPKAAGAWGSPVINIIGPAGAGSGDMLKSENLSGLANVTTARANLGLTIGTHVQAYNAGLQNISGLAKTDGNIIVGDGTNWVAESGVTARTSLGAAASATTVTGGGIATGGGDLSANRTITVPEASVAEYRNATADKAIAPDTAWGAAAKATLTDAATVAVDMSAGFNFTVTLGGNRTLGNPTNVKEGQTGIIEIIQDATGSRTLAYGANWKFAGGTAPILTTTAGARDVLSYVALSSTAIFATLIADVK